MKRNLIIGLIISAIFIYLTIRGIDFSELAKSFNSANYLYFIPTIIITLLALYIRSYRWGIILQPLIKYDQWPLFVITSLGYMAISLLPARLGEFTRPYLIKKRNGIRMSSTFATIIVERIFDLLSLMILLFVVILRVSLPPFIFRAALTSLVVVLIIFLILILLAVKKEFSLKKIDLVLNKFPSRIEQFSRHFIHAFVEGLEILPDIKRTLCVALLSIFIWVLIGLSGYVLFFAFGFDLPLIVAYALLVIVAFGVMLPAAPGFIGNFHFSCVLGLTLFGVSKSEALSYAIALHFLQMIPIVTTGLLLLPFQKISLPKFFSNEEDELKKEGLDK
jgi:uncharacterized protein (TIRG00374 family)